MFRSTVWKNQQAALSTCCLAVVVASAPTAHADEGGVSFWAPGLYGSLAAAPSVPGWQFGLVYYHTTVNADRGQNFRIGGGIQGGLDARGDTVFINGTYVWATPVLGAQLATGMSGVTGRLKAGVNATLTGPLGNAISGSREDSLTGFGDLYPTASLKWNFGVHNLMIYTMFGLPVGAYDPNRLANLGIGHWSWDNGLGYTYFNPHTGWEFSAVLGFTYNFKNPYTDYQNGVDGHIDWAASYFLTKQWQIGIVGYFYHQLTGDSGSGAALGDFKSRVNGIGPQIGYIFPVGDMQGYLNLKGYKEFGAANRPEGWNVWLTFAISPAAPPSASPPRHLVTKARY